MRSDVLTAVWLKICVFWEVKLQYRVAVSDVPKSTVPSKHWNVLISDAVSHPRGLESSATDTQVIANCAQYISWLLQETQSY
jgi:hypothetical protein